MVADWTLSFRALIMALLPQIDSRTINLIFCNPSKSSLLLFLIDHRRLMHLQRYGFPTRYILEHEVGIKLLLRYTCLLEETRILQFFELLIDRLLLIVMV